MHFFLKLIFTNFTIIFCTWIGKRYPTLGGLIATMPLTSLLVLVWLHADNPGDYRLLVDFTRGVLWGIIPTILFYAVTYAFFRRQVALPLVLSAGFGVWLAGALVHQWLLR
jgi:F0F1-type ATP synthase assembly protein I